MSYCRWGPGSDVYLFLGTDDHLHCCCCRLNPPENRRDFVTGMYSGMLSHLEGHKAAGHLVPDDAIQELESEAEEQENKSPNWDPKKLRSKRNQ